MNLVSHARPMIRIGSSDSDAATMLTPNESFAALLVSVSLRDDRLNLCLWFSASHSVSFWLAYCSTFEYSYYSISLA